MTHQEPGRSSEQGQNGSHRLHTLRVLDTGTDFGDPFLDTSLLPIHGGVPVVEGIPCDPSSQNGLFSTVISVMDFTITDESTAMSLSIEKEKTIKYRGCVLSSYSMKRIQLGICLLLVELCERFAFFEVVCNMLPFCTVKLSYRNYQAAILNLCFIGTSMLTPVFVGWLADVYLGRNKMVCVCLLLHFLGSTLLFVVAFPIEDFYLGTYHVVNNIPIKEQNRLFYVALLTISLGTGGIRAIVCPLGAYGLQECGSKKQMSFFNWFYWLTNLTAIVVFLGITCIQHSGAWAFVLLAPFVSALMALITLHMMNYKLIYKPEKCFSLLVTFGVLVNALKTCCVSCRLGRDMTSWLDHAKRKNGGCYSELHVENTKAFFTILPLFIFQILYRMCVMQIPSGYYLQTMHSNLSLDGLLLPIAVMNAISTLPLLILVPFMECFSSCLFSCKRDGPFLPACIIAGNLSAVLSVMVAGCSEIHRKHFPPMEQPLSGKVLTVSSMSGFHLVLQYVLLGVAETLVNPASSVIVWRSVPHTIRRTAMNFLTLFNGFGCYTGALLVKLVYLFSEGNWFPNTLNKGNLEIFFFLLASLTLLNLLGFWSVSQRYCNLNHFNAQNISGSNLEETLLLCEKSLKFYGSTQEISSSIDLWETAL
ncbi:solute carrier family 15 member 5 [Fukomys damarensis]|uniref:solute carrier family 15 member 5 n=1 Tax=Fukomys damarensis TaxID=885580 RepID=UPI0008FECC2B|nr:solute carrier family 15 member 5 [Fukomys damarensis]